MAQVATAQERKRGALPLPPKVTKPGAVTAPVAPAGPELPINGEVNPAGGYRIKRMAAFLALTFRTVHNAKPSKDKELPITERTNIFYDAELLETEKESFAFYKIKEVSIKPLSKADEPKFKTVKIEKYKMSDYDPDRVRPTDEMEQMDVAGGKLNQQPTSGVAGIDPRRVNVNTPNVKHVEDLAERTPAPSGKAERTPPPPGRGKHDNRNTVAPKLNECIYT